MAAELGFQSQQSEDHHQSAPGFTVSSWVWNPMRTQDEDDSWEVRAFAEDSGSIMGTTWPPRSYTCTFCGREFRSAQALGGHMNVHRRDRARLQQSPPKSMVQSGYSSSPSPSSQLIFPPQELVTNGGLCLLYGLQVPNLGFTHENGSIQLRSSLSSSPYLPNYKPSQSIPASVFFQQAQTANSEISSSSNSHPAKVDEHTQIVANDEHEELDLELRLGHGRQP